MTFRVETLLQTDVRGAGQRKDIGGDRKIEGDLGRGRGREGQRNYLKLEKSMFIPLGCKLPRRNIEKACFRLYIYDMI